MKQKIKYKKDIKIYKSLYVNKEAAREWYNYRRNISFTIYI